MKKTGKKQQQIIYLSMAKTSIVTVNRSPLMEFSIGIVSLPSPFQTDNALFTCFTYQIEII